MNAFLRRLLFALAILCAPPLAANAACGSIPFTFTNNVSTVDAATTNTNNSFLLTCAINVDSSQIGAAGIWASQVLPNSIINATFTSGFNWRFTTSSSSQTPLTVVAPAGVSSDIFQVYAPALATKYVWVDLLGVLHATGAPQTTLLTSGSGTYTTPLSGGVGPLYLAVTMVGGGGGGGGSGTGSPTSGNGGGSTIFGGLTAGGGTGGNQAAAGGSGGAGGTVTGSATIYANTGQGGTGGAQALASMNVVGGAGGSAFLGGGGVGLLINAAGGSAVADSGSGGAGAASDGGSTGAGGGGGAGAGIMTLIASPAATYSYTVGTAGSGGLGGTSGYAGGNGAAGFIVIVAYWR